VSDHVTVSNYATSDCTVVARRKLLGDGVLAGVAIAAGAVGLLLLADRRRTTNGTAA